MKRQRVTFKTDKGKVTFLENSQGKKDKTEGANEFYLEPQSISEEVNITAEMSEKSDTHLDNCICEGCQVEMEECYKWQSIFFDAGLHWNKGHCYFFVLNKKGEIIAGWVYLIKLF